MKKLVIIESPYGTRVDGTRCTPEEIEYNTKYAQACMLDSLRRDEAPFGSHLIYPQVLDDATPEERKMGMEAGFAWGKAAAEVDGRLVLPDSECRSEYQALVAVYEDLGITDGMRQGIAKHAENGLPIEFRKLGGAWAVQEREPPGIRSSQPQDMYEKA